VSGRYRFVWGEDVISLPKDNLLKVLSDAGESELRTLICLASERDFRSEEGFTKLCELLDCTQSSLRRDLKFWENAGVICLTDGEELSDVNEMQSSVGTAAVTANVPMAAQSEPGTAAEKKRPRFLQSQVLPEYSEKDCSEIIKASGDLSSVIDTCQQLVGKMFRLADVSIIVGMYDHAGLDSAYIVTLFAWYVGKAGDRFSMRGIEKMSLDLIDSGIDTVDALNEYIRKQDMRKDGITKLRGMLSIGERDLTPKEEETFKRWFDEWDFSMEIVSRAWEVTVDQTGNAPLAYINKVLKNWYDSNLHTLEEIDSVIDTFRKNKTDTFKAKEDVIQKPVMVNGVESGFDTKKAFEAALQRSYQMMLEGEEEDKREREREKKAQNKSC